ncbi:MAG: AAA family ATPase [Nanoarchaeota archaeon]|nr:AAA family ATPase [Nanoarchaeota archaeon]
MKISTGNKEFDEFLSGGYEGEVITTIYGPAGVGKSNLCMIAAVEQARKGKKVIFIDTEGGFSVDRLGQVGEESLMKNILVLKATTFSEQRDVFNRLLEEMLEGKNNSRYYKNYKENSNLRKDVGLIIVDSIAMLYRLEIGNARGEGDESKVNSINRNLAWQLKVLSEISRKKLIPIMVTNQVYSDFVKRSENNNFKRPENGSFQGNPGTEEKKVHMVGGDLLKYWSKCIIELKRDGEKRKAILRKHRSLPEKDFNFYITMKGISKSGFRLF